MLLFYYSTENYSTENCYETNVIMQLIVLNCNMFLTGFMRFLHLISATDAPALA